MLLRKGKRFAICYGTALISAMLILVLLSTGQASLDIRNDHVAKMRPYGDNKVPHEGRDILMGHPSLHNYISENPQTNEILKVLITAGSNQSTTFASYPIQYHAVTQHHANELSAPRAAEL